MLKYIAYKLGGNIPYPVSQIVWKKNEEYVFFDGCFYNTKDCILCADTGYKDCKGKKIYEGDILRLDIEDKSCYNKGKMGIVSFYDTRFCWSPLNGWETYSLAGKKWTRLGNVACDMEKFFNEECVEKNHQLREVFKKIKGYFIGVFVEKKIQRPPINKEDNITTNTESAVKKYEKHAKKLLHQYKNYLKIKAMIENKEISTEIFNSHLQPDKID